MFFGVLHEDNIGSIFILEAQEPEIKWKAEMIPFILL